MSKQMQKEDDCGDYYRSGKLGVVPVRWTAPECLLYNKYSVASDVWAFGITCIEVFQDGVLPYHETRSNPALMALVTGGSVHPQPAECDDGV